MLIGTLVTGLGGTLFSGYKAVVCSPCNGLIPVFAVIVSRLYVSFGSEYSIAAEATIIVAIMVTTTFAALFLLLLGRLKLGNLVRYISYPVTGGFFPGVHDASDTALVDRLGGKDRLMGIVNSLLVAAAILAGTEFMELVPTFLLGGLLIYVGLEFGIDWVWKARDELPLSDYAVVILILVVIIFSDILQAVTFGFFVAIILFVVNYSKLSVIKIETNGSDSASYVDRDLETRELLNKEGHLVLIMVLQGFIFFAAADKLITPIRNRIMELDGSKFDFLVLDFHHVSQLDSSVIVTFSKLAQLSDRIGFQLVISSADEKSIKQ